MAVIRIQVLELPSVHVGEAIETPFVPVLSGVAAHQHEDIDSGMAGIKEATGARGVLVFDEPDVQVG